MRRDMSSPSGQFPNRQRTPRLHTNPMELAMTDSPLSSLSAAIADVVARAAPAIVSVHSHRSRASGFIWKTGFVITADEALAEEGEVSVRLADGTTRQAV